MPPQSENSIDRDEVSSPPERSSKSTLIGFLSLTILSGIFLSPTLTHFSGFLDEGLVLAPAQRVLSGEVVYRDFYLFTTPVGIYLYALFMKLFGSGVVSTGLCRLLVQCLGLGGIYLLSRTILEEKLAFLPPLVLLFSYLHHTGNYVNHWLANLTFVWALYLLVRAVEIDKKSFLVVAGVMVAQAGMTLQTFGVILLISGMVAFWGSVHRIMWWLIGVALGALPWFLFFALTGGLEHFYLDAIVSNLDRSGFESVSLASFWNILLGELEKSWWYLPTFLLLTLCPLIASLGPPLFRVTGSKSLERRHWVIYISSILMLFVCCYRLLPSQLLMHHFLSVIIFVFLCQELGSRGKPIAWIFTLALLPLGLGYWQDYGFVQRHTVQFPQGEVWVRSPGEAKGLQELVAFLDEHLQGQDSVLLTPYVPNLYYLMNLKPATRFIQLRSRQYTKEHMLSAVEDLKSKNLPKIVHFPIYESDAFLRGSWPDEDPQLYYEQRDWFMGVLSEHYKMRDFGALELFEPKSEL